MTVSHARAIAAWRYPGRWSVYDVDSAESVQDGYSVVLDGNQCVVGYPCTGAEARVPGLDADPDLLDLGVGMDPALVGRGNGPAFMAAVLDAVRGERVALRAVVQDWNERSLRLARRSGFVDAGDVDVHQDDRTVRYRILIRDQ